ncbi:holo-ACP synthase [Corynebacterium mendelii]|uniref:Holo-[acyl-carrier-protein] synthase n=1 Tax=Corynebacterium mendelii TaxID=2765362 RepID=A0A939E1K0_9CORY|nr:holo-ACP synthase [Corynebacterium mendelii]MBN9643842.1 holo-ACP synthase [Corynebacterium mendelii]
MSDLQGSASPFLPATGIDLVHIPSFGEQLAQPGTRFMDVFSAREQRTANRKPPFSRTEHLAGRWAAKEAFIKAWSQALYGCPPVVAEEKVDFTEIEVIPDAFGRVAINLAGHIRQAVDDSIGPVQCSLSISHDGDYATAIVVLADGIDRLVR